MPNSTHTTDDAPQSLQEQTIALGKMLKSLADTDPVAHPSEAAAAAFRAWLAEAGPTSRDPRYFRDVAENYDILGRSRRDLFDLFDILENYIEVDDEWEADAPPSGGFIGLPMA